MATDLFRRMVMYSPEIAQESAGQGETLRFPVWPTVLGDPDSAAQTVDAYRRNATLNNMQQLTRINTIPSPTGSGGSLSGIGGGLMSRFSNFNMPEMNPTRVGMGASILTGNPVLGAVANALTRASNRWLHTSAPVGPTAQAARATQTGMQTIFDRLGSTEGGPTTEALQNMFPGPAAPSNRSPRTSRGGGFAVGTMSVNDMSSMDGGSRINEGRDPYAERRQQVVR